MKVAVPSTGSRVQVLLVGVQAPFAPRSIRSRSSEVVLGVWRRASLSGSLRWMLVARSQVLARRSGFERRAVASSSPTMSSSGKTLWMAAIMEAWAAKSAIVTGEESLLSRAPLSTAESSSFVRMAARCTAKLASWSSLAYGVEAVMVGCLRGGLCRGCWNG